MFTVDELITEVRKLANENPDFVYDEAYCFYTRGGDCDNPGCLIGRAIVNLDSSLKSVLEKVDENGGIGVTAILDKLNLASQPTIFTLWLEVVQHKQDSGYMWAKTIEIADEIYSVN